MTRGGSIEEAERGRERVADGAAGGERQLHWLWERCVCSVPCYVAVCRCESQSVLSRVLSHHPVNCSRVCIVRQQLQQQNTVTRNLTAMEAQDNYEYQTAGNEMGYDPNAVQEDPYAGLDEDGKAALQEEFRQELAKTEEEIATLRQVLASKSKHAAELKRKLGISAWKEWTSDLGQGVKNLQETTAYVALYPSLSPCLCLSPLFSSSLT